VSLGVTAHIDLTAFVHNYHQIRRIVGQERQILAMVKADAYGHGLLPVAQCLSAHADAFGVATLEEALSLRAAKITQPIIVMTGFMTEDQLDLFFEHQLSPVIYHSSQLDLIEQYNTSSQIDAWLKVDTGMHRLGFSSAHFPDVFERLSALTCLRQPLTVMTHLADADNLDLSFSQQQLQLFSQLTESITARKSVQNSAGVVVAQDMLFDVVRPGIMLYGASPFSYRTPDELDIKPVMHLTTQLIAINALKKGDRIGYGATWQCPEDMPVGVIRMGYGDGYPRHIDENTPVLIAGQQCPIVGRVSMDLMTVDIRRQPNANVGDEVVLWGRGLPVERIAAAAHTIPYELFCQLTSRVKFHYFS
jgi:alanine racemase